MAQEQFGGRNPHRGWRRARFFIAALASAVVFSGCFEFSQEVWVRDDHTGRIRMDFGITEALTALAAQSGQDPLAEIRAEYEKTRQELEAHPNVSSCKIEEFSADGLRHLVLDVEIADTRAMDTAFTDKLSQGGLLGGPDTQDMAAPGWNMRLATLPNGNMEFAQDITTEGEGIPPQTPTADPNDPFASMGEAMGRAMLGSMFGDRHISVTLHAPTIVSANGQINEDRTIVTWQIPLVELMEGPGFHRELRAEFETPTDWVPWIIGAAALWIVFMGFVVAASLVHRRRLPRESPDYS